MSTRGFSRRDLLQLGGKLVMTVGAAKVVIALPGCGDDGGGGVDAPTDGPPSAIDSSYAPTYTLDDCYAFGTYDYAITYPGYTYHYYFTNVYGCPYYLEYPYSGVYCYLDTTPPNDYLPGYDYFCFFGYYTATTTP
jgi:hypothetical protein